MDVDAVRVVIVEGKSRDITLTGAKEVKDYVQGHGDGDPREFVGATGEACEYRCQFR